jgi:hypothetical protein
MQPAVPETSADIDDDLMRDIRFRPTTSIEDRGAEVRCLVSGLSSPLLPDDLNNNSMRGFFRNRRPVLILVHDLVVTAPAMLATLWVRFADGQSGGILCCTWRSNVLLRCRPTRHFPRGRSMTF